MEATHLNSIHDTEYSKGVHHSDVGMEVAGHSTQRDDSKESYEQRNLHLVEGVMVDVVEVLPARPVDARVREKGDSHQEGKDDRKCSGEKGGRECWHETAVMRWERGDRDIVSVGIRLCQTTIF